MLIKKINVQINVFLGGFTTKAVTQENQSGGNLTGETTE